MDELEQFKQTYFQESEELLGELETHLMALEEGQTDSETLNAVFRAIHSIKGGAGAFGFESLVSFSHTAETALDMMREGNLEPTPDRVSVLLTAGDILADLVHAAQAGENLAPDHGAEVLRKLEVMTGGGEEEDPELSDDDLADIDFEPIPADDFDGEVEAEEEAPAEFSTWRITFVPTTEMLQRANEPLLLVRELKTLGALNATPDLSKLPGLIEMKADESYISWEFELETTSDRDAIDEVFEFVADDCDLTIVKEGGEETPREPEPVPEPAPQPEPAPAPLPKTKLRPKAKAKPQPESETVEAVPAPPAKPETAKPEKKPEPAKAAAPAAPQVTSIRVDLDKVDKLVNMVGELVITQAMLAEQTNHMVAENHPNLVQGLDELSQHTRELQDSVMAIRAQPVKSVFQRVPRLVREIAAQTGKKVRLVTSGEGTEIDKTVIEQLGDPLTHMIRNAVDHGIEAPDSREAKGKPAEGTIHLSADHRGGRIVIEIEDDGNGIPRDKVLKKAIDKGLVPPGVTLTDEEIDNLIFAPGFSTADEVSNISGRGVGMDVVKRNIQALGGRVLVRSTPGEGSTFQMTLPLTLAVLDGMVVRVAEQTYVLPLANITESLRPKAEDIHVLVGGGEVIAMRGDYLQIVRLHRVFGLSGALEDPSKALVVMVETEGDNRVGLVVDEILGQQQVVIKSLEENFDPVDGVAAATILGSGRVALILDVVGLKKMADRDVHGRRTMIHTARAGAALPGPQASQEAR